MAVPICVTVETAILGRAVRHPQAIDWLPQRRFRKRAASPLNSGRPCLPVPIRVTEFFLPVIPRPRGRRPSTNRRGGRCLVHWISLIPAQALPGSLGRCFPQPRIPNDRKRNPAAIFRSSRLRRSSPWRRGCVCPFRRRHFFSPRLVAGSSVWG